MREKRAAAKRDIKTELVRSVTKALDMPKEITLNLPLISMIGNDDFIIENYKGIIEYADESIRISCSTGVIKITGKKLILKHITSESIAISGRILLIEFLR